MDSPTYKEHFTEEQCIAMAADGHHYADQCHELRYAYFIGLNPDGLVKIGFTADLRTRIKHLRQMHHKSLEILALRKGGLQREQAYHVQFAHYRVVDEWFEPAPSIVKEIVRLRRLSLEIPSMDRRFITNDITRLLGG